MERLVFHVDVNSAFLSWEAAYRIHHLGGTLDLRSIPSAVSGDQEARHGIILANRFLLNNLVFRPENPFTKPCKSALVFIWCRQIIIYMSAAPMHLLNC